jgi:ketosteroid isomerase-like protein
MESSTAARDTARAMSRENVEIVRRAVDAFNRREVPVELLDPEVEWIEDPRYPGAQTYRGPDGVERSIEKWREAWASQTMHVDGMADGGDKVAFWGVVEAGGTDSEITLSAPFGHVCEFRDGLIARVRMLGGRDEALEAAGLSE